MIRPKIALKAGVPTKCMGARSKEVLLHITPKVLPETSLKLTHIQFVELFPNLTENIFYQDCNKR